MASNRQPIELSCPKAPSLNMIPFARRLRLARFSQQNPEVRKMQADGILRPTADGNVDLEFAA
jgi:hypothetical protein